MNDSLDLSLLNPAQKEAVLHNSGNLLVSAGAGSGKTRVIAYKIAYLIKELSVPQQNILAVTFTNKAAYEMKERVEKLTAVPFFLGQISTFHSFCLKVLRKEAFYLGYSKDFAVCDAYDSAQIVKDVLKNLKIKLKHKPKLVHGLISAVKNGRQPDLPSDISEDMLETILKNYNNYLKNNNLMDFDDLLLNTVDLFEKNPNVLTYYKSLYPFVLVDEFQDTNSVQYTLVKLLAGDCLHLCVVGDEDQSIYGWRGAEYRNISSFVNDFPDVKVVKLEKNYRSTVFILEAANSVISRNRERIPKRLYSDNKNKGKMVVYGAYSPREEAEFVVKRIKEIAHNGDNYSSFSILYRANYVSRNFEDVLRREKIPYRIVGGIKFYERKEIKDLIAYLRLINNPYDNVSFKRVINIPKRGIGEKTLEKLEGYSPSLFYAIDNIPDGFPRGKILKSFKSLIEELKKQPFDSDFFHKILEKTEYPAYLKDEFLPHEAEARLANVMEFYNVFADYLKREENPTLAGFLDEISLVSDTDELSEDSVNLMTIHSAKGLEFKTVFIVGLEEGLFPSAKSSDSEEGLEEERRLMYVAITRAKENLFLSFSKTRGFGNRNFDFKSPSRFFKELPLDMFESAGYSPVEIRDFSQASFNERGNVEDFSVSFPRDSFSKGENVFHSRYGEGRVMNLIDGGAKVIVKFKRFGIKILRADTLKKEEG